jgi:SPP1 family predicted phage head-tail adaptor
MSGIGELRQRVTLQQEVPATDGAGGYGLVWADIVTLWAKVEPLTGRERVAARKIEESVTHRILLRRRRDVTAAMRIFYDGRLFNIRTVRDLGERDRFTELLAEEGVAL